MIKCPKCGRELKKHTEEHHYDVDLDKNKVWCQEYDCEYNHKCEDDKKSK